VDLPKIILYYAFAPVADRQAVVLWQRASCAQHGLKGRIIVSKHGINGTVGGPMSEVKKYVRSTKQYPGFGKMDVKWSEGTGHDFPRLSIKARPELVVFVALKKLSLANQVSSTVGNTSAPCRCTTSLTNVETMSFSLMGATHSRLESVDSRTPSSPT